VTAARAITTEELRENVAYHAPVVKLGAARTPLDAAVLRRLVRVVVDTHLNLPDMFELTFLDLTGTAITDAGITLGMELQVCAPSGRQAEVPVIVGEVTALEGRYGETTWLTVVRGYSHDHRLQRARRARTFVDLTDSDVARTIAGDAGLTVGLIEATTVKHPQLAQADQTDWAFLSGRAAEIGYEVGAADGRFFFRRAHTVTSGAALPAVMGETLVRFNPRVNAANLVPEVEARAQDPTEARAVGVTAALACTSADIGAGAPGTAAARFAPTKPAPPPPTAENGPAATAKGYVAGRGFSITAGSDQALKEAATALAAHVGSSFAEADGELLGDAKLVAGAVLDVTGVPSQFCGKWLVTGARHVFDGNDRGYRVRATVSGRHDRSLLSLTSHGPARTAPAGVGGVVCGVVTDVKDPLNLARVRVMLPWLSPDYVTGWAPVSQLFAGSAGGALFLPQPKDQVLVAFEHGDLRRPYVLGSVVNNRTGAGIHLDGSSGSAKPGASAVGSGQPAPIVRRGIVSPTGSRVVFHDEAPPSGGKPTTAQVIVATGQDKLGLTMDAVAGTLTIVCKPGSPPGTLVIECDGDVQLKAGASGSLTVDGGKQLTLKAQLVTIEGTGAVAVKGKPIQLN
jgi:phage protein D